MLFCLEKIKILICVQKTKTLSIMKRREYYFMFLFGLPTMMNNIFFKLPKNKIYMFIKILYFKGIRK